MSFLEDIAIVIAILSGFFYMMRFIIHLASNIMTSDGSWSAYSEGTDHKLSASSEGGPSENKRTKLD